MRLQASSPTLRLHLTAGGEMRKPAYTFSSLTNHLIKRNLRRCLRGIDIFVECAVSSVLLLLDSGAKFHQVFRHVLIRGLENINEPAVIVSQMPPFSKHLKIQNLRS